MATSRELAQKEGIFTGTSGGGCLSAALAFCADVEACPPGSTVVAMLPDTGERYLSTPLFADIPADMTAEEILISESTPSAAPGSIEMPPVTDEALAFVQASSGLVDGVAAAAPVVVWSLEYCEFCWTARDNSVTHNPHTALPVYEEYSSRTLAGGPSPAHNDMSPPVSYLETWLFIIIFIFNICLTCAAIPMVSIYTRTCIH